MGAIFGIASFSYGLRYGIPVSKAGLPVFIELSKSGLMFSYKLVVFSNENKLDIFSINV